MTRVWGLKAGAWTAFETDSSGSDDLPNLIWLQNALLLNTNESPFYADWGIPVRRTLITGIFPGYYVALTQNRFSKYFASCVITQATSTVVTNISYSVNVTTKSGFTFNQTYSQAQ